MEKKALVRRMFAAAFAMAALIGLWLGVHSLLRLTATARAEDEAALTRVTETYLETQGLRLEQTAREGDYMAALWTDEAGEWVMCEYERDKIWRGRWEPQGSKAARPGEISSWNYGSPRNEAVIIVFGAELDGAVGGYVLKAQRRFAEDGRVLNIHVYPDSRDISHIPLPLDREGKLLAADG